MVNLGELLLGAEDVCKKVDQIMQSESAWLRRQISLRGGSLSRPEMAKMENEIHGALLKILETYIG